MSQQKRDNGRVTFKMIFNLTFSVLCKGGKEKHILLVSELEYYLSIYHALFDFQLFLI